MKKIKTDTHSGPIWGAVVLLIVLSLLFWFETFIMLTLVGAILFLLGTPYAITWVWNKLIATQDDYYE